MYKVIAQTRCKGTNNFVKACYPPLNNVKIMNFVCGGDSRGALVSQGDCPRVSLFGKLFLFVIMKSCPKREKPCKEKGNTVYYT